MTETPPEERRALARLLCEPMSPGVDYESAIWGAAQVLLLIREEKQQPTCTDPQCSDYPWPCRNPAHRPPGRPS